MKPTTIAAAVQAADIEMLKAELKWRSDPPRTLMAADGTSWVVTTHHVVRADIVRAGLVQWCSTEDQHAGVDLQAVLGGEYVNTDAGAPWLPKHYRRLVASCSPAEVGFGVARFRRDGELVAVVALVREGSVSAESMVAVGAAP